MHIARAVLALLITVSAAAGTFPVSDAPLGTPPDYRTVPEVVAGANGYLAFWGDLRSSESAILATRINAEGEVLDPAGIVLARSGAAAHGVWNGERYLLFFATGSQIAMLTIGEDGTVTPLRTVIANARVDSQQPISVTTNNRRIVIAYAGEADGYPTKPRVHAAVLSMDGTLLNDMVIDSRRADRLVPSVAMNHDAFAIGWNVAAADKFALHVVRLSSHGMRLDDEPHVTGSDYLESTLHANGNGYLAISNNVTWFVSADLATTTAPVERSPGTAFTLRGNVAFASRDFPTETSQATPSYLQITPYDASGRAGDGQLVLRVTPDSSSGLAGVSAAQRGNDVLFAMMITDRSTLRATVAIAQSDTLAMKTPQRELTLSATRQHSPALAIGDTESLVAWIDEDAVYAARITPDGRRLDGRGIRISDAASYGSRPPSVVYHDGVYAIAFAQFFDQHTEVTVRFVSPTEGLLTDAVRIPAGRPYGGVALASGGGALMFAWSAGEQVSATRIHAHATFDPPVLLDASAVQPTLAWNGTHFLVAWVNYHLDFDWVYQFAISGRRITSNLGIVDAESNILAYFGPGAEHTEPTLASDGREWLLAATHYTSPYSPNLPWDEKKEVRLVHIDANALPYDATGTRLGRGFAPRLTRAGSRYVIAWKDDTIERPLMVAQLDTNATQTFDAPTPLYEGYWFESAIGIASRNEQWAVAYPRLDVGAVPRVFATFGGPAQPRRRAVR